MFKVFEGFDHYNGIPIYQVIGDVYVGEWTTNEEEAKAECKALRETV